MPPSQSDAAGDHQDFTQWRFEVANRPKRDRKTRHHQVRSAVAATTTLLFALAALAHEVSSLVH